MNLLIERSTNRVGGQVARAAAAALRCARLAVATARQRLTAVRPGACAGRMVLGSARSISGQILLIVLALWYSRAALGRCYSGAACHTATGRENLEAEQPAHPAHRPVPGRRRVRRGDHAHRQHSSGGGTAAGPSPSPTTAKVVKAAVDIAAGTTVTASMVELDEVPLAAAGPTPSRTRAMAIGKTIRQAVTKGETLGYSFFVSSGVEANVTGRAAARPPGDGHPGLPGHRRWHPDPERRSRRRRDLDEDPERDPGPGQQGPGHQRRRPSSRRSR
jgi:hypothetical protein